MLSVNSAFFIHSQHDCLWDIVRESNTLIDNMNYSIFLKFRKVFCENLLTENNIML